MAGGRGDISAASSSGVGSALLRDLGERSRPPGVRLVGEIVMTLGRGDGLLVGLSGLASSITGDGGRSMRLRFLCEDSCIIMVLPRDGRERL